MDAKIFAGLLAVPVFKGIGWMPEARTNKQKISPFYMT